MIFFVLQTLIYETQSVRRIFGLYRLFYAKTPKCLWPFTFSLNAFNISVYKSKTFFFYYLMSIRLEYSLACILASNNLNTSNQN
jgi:hypothetical protein